MSNHLDPFSNPINIEIIQEIDNLDITVMQKHHLRILAHCLQILKFINVNNSFEYQIKIPLENGVITNPKNLMIKNLVIFFMSS